MADNTVTLVGNITRDPEIRFTTTGSANTSFGLAVNRRYQQNGEWQEKTSFFNVVVWGQLGENVAQSLHKGARIIVNGRLEQREYETRDGDKRNVVEVVADEIGPSLRWATAQVERTNRSSSSEGGERSDRPSSGGGGGGSDAPRSAERYGSGAGDEEPF